MSRIIGVGDNVVDLYLHRNTMYPGGNALNIAVFAKELGAQTAYMGVYGTDKAGGWIRQVLDKLDVDQARCRVVEGENGYSAVNLVDGDRTYVGSNDGGVSKSHPLELAPDDLTYIHGFDLAHTSCYSHIEPQLPKLKQAGPLVSFDFSDRFTESYAAQVCPYVDISLISCGKKSDEEVSGVIQRAHDAGCSMVLASMGRRGARLSFKGKVYAQPSGKEKAIDTLGAGDAFFTAFIVNYLDADKDSNQDETIQRCLAEGAEYATKVCMRDGAFGYGIEIE